MQIPKVTGFPKRPGMGTLPGRETRVETNYYRVTFKGKDKRIYKYDAKFDPEIPEEYTREKNKVLKSVAAEMAKDIGFNVPRGAIIYAERKNNEALTYKSKETKHTVYVKLTIELDLKWIVQESLNGRNESLQFLNVMIKNACNELGMVEVGAPGKEFFREELNANPIKDSCLKVWKGFDTTIHILNSTSVCLLVNCSTRVLRKGNVLDYFKGMNKDDINEEFSKKTVIANYGNHRSYRVCKVCWDKNPTDKVMEVNGTPTSLMDYYRTKYDKTITDKKQPLLLRVYQKKLPDGTKKEEISYFVPELMMVTGMIDEERKNGNLMKSLAEKTIIPPKDRLFEQGKFVPKLNEKLRLIEIEREPEVAESLMLSYPQIRGGEKKQFEVKDSGKFENTVPYGNFTLQKYVIVYYSGGKRDDNEADDLADILKKCSSRYGVAVEKPGYCVVKDNNLDGFKKAINSDVDEYGFQSYYMVILNQKNEYLYNGLKTFLSSTLGVVSQFVKSRTIGHKNALSIASKILLQMGAKNNIPLWKVEEPIKGKRVMVVGYEFYHKLVGGDLSCIGFVATSNAEGTRFYSRPAFVNKGKLYNDGILIMMQEALVNYQKHEKKLPEVVVVYRSALGEGDFKTIRENQIQQTLRSFQETGKQLKIEYSPKLLFLTCNKKVSQKFYNKGNNPFSGTLVHKDLSRYGFDFFMAAQNVERGCCTPTHYVCLHNDSDLTQSELMKLTFWQCFGYFGWSGAVKVPCVLQYAKKLSMQGGDVVKRDYNENMDGLHFI